MSEKTEEVVRLENLVSALVDLICKMQSQGATVPKEPKLTAQQRRIIEQVYISHSPYIHWVRRAILMNDGSSEPTP